MTVPGRRRRDRGRDPRAPARPFVLEERMTGPECSLLALCDGRTALGPAAGPGPQAHRRGRHRPEHRRDGRLRAGAGAVRRRRAGGDVRAAGARPLRRRRHAVRRRALRRADADGRRPAPRRVQRPLRRPRGPGRAAAAAHATSPRSPSPRTAGRRSPTSPLDDRRRRRLHRRRRRRRLPGRPAARRRGSDRPIAATARTEPIALRVPGRDGRRPSRPAGGCSPSPGSAPTSPPPATPPTTAMARISLRRDAGAPRHRLAGARRRRCARTPPPASTSTRATAPSPR